MLEKCYNHIINVRKWWLMNLEYLMEHGILDLMLDHINDGLNVVDRDGNLIYANQVSADYAETNRTEMIGKHISEFYPDAVLLKSLNSKKAVLDQKIHYVGTKRYLVSSYPISDESGIIGAYSVFRDIREIDELNRTLQNLKVQISLSRTEDDISSIIGNDDSLKSVLMRAKRTIGSLGGPRHSIIIGDSGTGKTMLANMIYNYGKEIGSIGKDAPFIEVNCAQFTNSDIAALEIFGSEEGSFTGAKQKKGLLEKANGGILFLDEAHALEDYQSLLLTAVESGRFRRLGGNKEIYVDVIIIAASTRNLKEKLLPELYQRLAQYELYLPPLKDRSIKEKESLFDYFIEKYEAAVLDIHSIEYKVLFEDDAKNILLSMDYPRNIRQFRDVINFSIDQASPLIEDIRGNDNITVNVNKSHLPFEFVEESKVEGTEDIYSLIDELSERGLGPRKISNMLKEKNFDMKYYQVAYYLKKKKMV